MDMRGRFLRLVVIAVIGLGVVFMVQIGMDLTIPLTEGEIGYFNLLVDVVVGSFTVLGLYWVANELALRPELRLYIEGLDEPDVLEGKGDHRGNVVKCGLYLTNARPKAARFVRIVLFVCNLPLPEYAHGSCIHHDGTESVFYWHEEGEGLLGYSVQYPENFVVYKGERLKAGYFELRWPQGIFPKQVRFLADLYSLESEPKAVEITLPIRWAGEWDGSIA